MSLTSPESRPSQPASETKSVFKNPSLYSSIVLVVVAVALDQMGGKTLDIQAFYANPGVIHRGETVQLCYGVANAKTVKLEPQENPVWPSYARCVDVKPAKTTTYTLTIDDGAGNTKTQSLEVKVL
jgi:hypothetical protein